MLKPDRKILLREKGADRMIQIYNCSNEFPVVTSIVVYKEEFDEFAKQVDVELEALDKGLANVRNNAENNNRSILILNNYADDLFHQLGRIDDTVKTLIVSNIITAVVAVAGVVLAFLV